MVTGVAVGWVDDKVTSEPTTILAKLWADEDASRVLTWPLELAPSPPPRVIAPGAGFRLAGEAEWMRWAKRPKCNAPSLLLPGGGGGGGGGSTLR